MPAVGRLDARDALERHALAAAGGAQQADHAAFRLKLRAQRERAQPLFDIDNQAHARLTAFFCRSSSRFTISSTTVLIARFTSTQNIAPASSFVRQS